MGNVTVRRRDPLPGETVFGGRGVLIPFRLPNEVSIQTAGKPPVSACPVPPAQGDAASEASQATEVEAPHPSGDMPPASSSDKPGGPDG
jgi:hypothetical protein